jgi:hypothetical protein
MAEAGVCEESGFSELIRFTLVGYCTGILAGFLLDAQGFKTSALGQLAVRTLSGEGESLFEGFFAIRKRLSGAKATMAEAYGWGKLFGMAVPWVVDLGSRLAGVDVYGIEGFYIPYFYALSDQIGGNVAGFLFLKRQENGLSRALRAYFRSSVMVASLLVLTLVPIGLLSARLLGFSPTTQVQTALETIAANLCWVPPLIGWLAERSETKQG